MKEVHDHSFNVNVAEYFRSVEKAILLKEFYGWIKINKDNNRNVHYGEAWTYNSAEALNDKFRYMHPKSIWRWINELSIDGLICINRFNEKRYDKTNWYAINWTAYIAICEGKSELIEESISHFKKFQKLVFDSQNEKSISQNKKRYSQNEKSISQSEEPIPSLTISSSFLTISEPFVENSFSTVTLIDEVDETMVEIHHIPDYFEIKDQLKGLSEKDKKLTYEIMKDTPGFFDTEQINPTPQVAPPPRPEKWISGEEIKQRKLKREKKETPDNPAPIHQMFEPYAAKFAELTGQQPVFMKKYAKPLKDLYHILEARSIEKGIVPLDKLQPWKDFVEMWGNYLKTNPKEVWHRDNFNPMTFYSQFNSIIAKLQNRPQTETEKWVEWMKKQGISQNT